jgi:phosphatidylinositol alpha-1,6-mannosyltransferase
VVAGRSGGAPETVLDGVTGNVVDGRDVAQIAESVGTLLADPTWATEMGEAGRRWVSRHWRWEDIAGRLARLLDGSAF